MIPTVPIDLAFNVAVGASMAVTGHRSDPESLLRATSLWALIAFEMLLFAPGGAYLLHAYPDWSYMYLLEPGTLPIPDWAVALTYPVAAGGAYFVARRLLDRAAFAPAVGIAVAGLLLAGAVTVFGSEQLLRVGTVAEFREHSDTLPRIDESPLLFLVAGVVTAVTIGWLTTLWRLWLMGRSVVYEYVEEEAVADTQVKKPKPRKAGTKPLGSQKRRKAR